MFLPRDALQARPMSSCGVCLSVCPSSVTFVSCVKTNKRIIQIFHNRVATPFQFFHAKRHGNTLTRNTLTGASNAGGVGDSEPICLLLTLQQARCCKHGRRWTTATISQVVTIIFAGRILRVFDHQAPRAIKSPFPCMVLHII